MALDYTILHGSTCAHSWWHPAWLLWFVYFSFPIRPMCTTSSRRKWCNIDRVVVLGDLYVGKERSARKSAFLMKVEGRSETRGCTMCVGYMHTKYPHRERETRCWRQRMLVLIRYQVWQATIPSWNIWICRCDMTSTEQNNLHPAMLPGITPSTPLGFYQQEN